MSGFSPSSRKEPKLLGSPQLRERCGLGQKGLGGGPQGLAPALERE